MFIILCPYLGVSKVLLFSMFVQSKVKNVMLSGHVRKFVML